MSESEPIKFRLLGIKELSYAYKNPLETFKDSKQDVPIVAKINVNYRWHIEQNLFAVVIDLIYLIMPASVEEKEILNFSYMCEFNIDNLSKVLIVRSNNDFDMDHNIETSLVSISISTGRGILFAKTAGTFFNNLIIPIVNPSNFILSKKLKEKKS